MHGRLLSRYQQSKLDKAFARADREAALKKQRGLCAYCECQLTLKTVTRDHVIPRASGGLDGRNNIKAACGRCNRAKGSMPVKQFQRMIQFPQRGEPTAFLMIWVDLRLNRALNRMEERVMRAVGRRK